MKALWFFATLAFFASGALSQSNEPVQIDEFTNINCEDYLSRMDNAIIHAANNPAAQIYVIVYEGKERRYGYDRRGGRTAIFNP